MTDKKINAQYRARVAEERVAELEQQLREAREHHAQFVADADAALAAARQERDARNWAAETLDSLHKGCQRELAQSEADLAAAREAQKGAEYNEGMVLSDLAAARQERVEVERQFQSRTNAHIELQARVARLEQALKGVAKVRWDEGMFCFCSGVFFSYDQQHDTNCSRAREALAGGDTEPTSFWRRFHDESGNEKFVWTEPADPEAERDVSAGGDYDTGETTP